MKVYFFGVAAAGGAGHYLYDPGLEKVGGSGDTAIPFGYADLDAGLLPYNRNPAKGESQPQGIIHYAVKNGWSLIQFWDRSGDDRFGSNSSFLCDAIKSSAEMVALFREHFPTICVRFPFPLVVPD